MSIWDHYTDLTPQKYDDGVITASDDSPESRRIAEDSSKSGKNTDRMTISPEAKILAELDKSDESDEPTETEPSEPQDTKTNGEPLTDEEERKVEKLRQRDHKVRAHEQAHLSAAAGLAVGGANYQYETGPDGNQYAVSGEVKLRIPNGVTPEEDLRIAVQVERAALAPADPSPKDRSTAAKARHKAAQARQEIVEKNTEKMQGNGNNPKVAEAKEAVNAIRKENVVEDKFSIQNINPHIRNNDENTPGSAYDLNQAIIFDRGETHNIDMIV
ncbi:MAG: hypothetical protein HQ591_11265 [candidate division Zixibacteria bacterium]|nr:hypothetical protein [Candidatus Tariuqbacter arcticus]